jgi:type IV pilus assembly protein PilQ
MSKVYRLNQASAESAADYLANLGALVNKTFTTTSVSQETQSTGTPTQNTGATQSQTATITQIQSYGASQGPLRGLIGTTDSRLSTITLVGDPRLVAVAEAYLKQLDLRQRQVALSLKILDVDLNNDADTDNSFAFRWGNSFIVNNEGQLLANFGSMKPPGDAKAGLPGLFRPDQSASPSIGVGSLTPAGEPFLDNLGNTVFPGTQSNATYGPGFSRPGFGTKADPLQPGVTAVEAPDIEIVRDANGNIVGERITKPAKYTYGMPNNFAYPRNQFFDFVQAQIVSRTTKVLASPTLILQENPSVLREAGGAAPTPDDGQQGITNIGLDAPIGRRRGNEGVVRVGTNVVTGYNVVTPNNGPVVCNPELTTAGLVLGARVEKIDDNGFVTFTLSPSISAVTDFEQPPEGCGSRLNILSVRSLDTGAVRVRDGQTLILTGVISDLDREEVTKWPVVGDLPLVGQFFRASGKTRQKRELVIMVTPRIINDSEGGTYGYGWQPSTPQSRELMRNGR